MTFSTCHEAKPRSVRSFASWQENIPPTHTESKMKRILPLAALTLATAAMAQMPEMKDVATNAQLTINRLGDAQIAVEVQNPNATPLVDAPVCIALPAGTPYRSATVTIGGKEVPSQMDDLDGDGTKDELAFVVSLKAGGPSAAAMTRSAVTATVTFSTDEASADRYPARVSAQMFFKDKDKTHTVKQHIPTDTVSERVDNMYSAMHHHGPAFESELVAYRIYFDKKQSTDLYGKRVRQLELADGLWYSAERKDLIEERNFGDDIILVGQTVSIGTLRGWDDSIDEGVKDAKGKTQSKMVMIDPFAWRQAHIVAKGPVRTVVDMNVEGWQYQGRTLNLKSRYILYAGNRECEVIQQFEGDTKDVEFVTGVLRVGTLHPDDPALQKVRPSWRAVGTPSAEPKADEWLALASFGMDWADNNHELYPVPQRAGVACFVPAAYVTRQIEHPNQVLYGIHTDRQNAVRYYMSFCAPDKETFASWRNAEAWYKYVELRSRQLPARVVLK